MLVKVLVENTTANEYLGCEHGLSLHIQTAHHKILFDMGRKDLFLRNAAFMDIAIQDIDVAVISHGHYDHGGGLETFFENNVIAPVYISQRAFEPHYAVTPNTKKHSIGLDASLKNHERLRYTDFYERIDDELELFSTVTVQKFCSRFNDVLMLDTPSGLTRDRFEHEQNLIISENGKTLLLAGCAHKGIVNIVDAFRQQKGFYPNYVIAGFHLFNPSTGETESVDFVKQTAEALLQTGAVFYTCHCTGLAAFAKLKEMMGDNIHYLATGDMVQL